jgi:hypothetical protein
MAGRGHRPIVRNAGRCALIVALVVFNSLTLTACTPASSSVPPILLFNGTGTSPNDVAAVETILNDNHLDYSTVNSTQLNDMGESQLKSYRLMIVPGGNFIAMGDSLRSSTTASIHNAVRGGLHYLGICGGAFLAGDGTYRNLNLTSGVRFGFYADENRGVRKAAVAIAGVWTPALDQYWEDGPQFTGWGAVVGKYPDGTPAVVEGTFGKGWVTPTPERSLMRHYTERGSRTTDERSHRVLLTISQGLSVATEPQFGPPSLPVPGILADNTCPGLLMTFLMSGHVIRFNGTFIRRAH